jgi:nucleoid-associated protein YgaU
VATDRPAFSGRFNTGNEESALYARGFHNGTAPGALVIGWNGRHTAVTLPDGTPVSSGEGGGVRIGGGGAYQPQFSHHMYLPVDGDAPGDAPAPDAPPPAPPAPDAPPPAPPAPDAAPADAAPPAPPAPEAAPAGAPENAAPAPPDAA